MIHYGVDVSNWDEGCTIPYLDFCICKATEGLSYIDPTFDMFINDARNKCMNAGAYHFAGYASSAKDEAEFFYSKVKKYEGFCYPWLDFEKFEWDASVAVEYCETFVNRYHEISGIYPGIYISASLCQYFYDSWIPEKCELWVAGYPNNGAQSEWPDYNMPYDISPWVTCKIWQFTGQMLINGTYFDANIGYYADWFRTENTEENLLIACRVILGEYGNGEERVKKLTDEGYNYNTIQSLVNRIYEVL